MKQSQQKTCFQSSFPRERRCLDFALQPYQRLIRHCFRICQIRHICKPKLTERCLTLQYKVLYDLWVATQRVLLKRSRLLLGIFIAFLVISGLTAFPLLTELRLLVVLLKDYRSPLTSWIQIVHSGLESSYSQFPFLAYGTDWLAFAHIVIAVFFVQVYRDPARNLQTIDSGIIACLLVVPTALICGAIREIPFFWRLLDCMFGILGFIPLFLCRKYIHQMTRL